MHQVVPVLLPISPESLCSPWAVPPMISARWIMSAQYLFFKTASQTTVTTMSKTVALICHIYVCCACVVAIRVHPTTNIIIFTTMLCC